MNCRTTRASSGTRTMATSSRHRRWKEPRLRMSPSSRAQTIYPNVHSMQVHDTRSEHTRSEHDLNELGRQAFTGQPTSRRTGSTSRSPGTSRMIRRSRRSRITPSRCNPVRQRGQLAGRDREQSRQLALRERQAHVHLLLQVARVVGIEQPAQEVPEADLRRRVLPTAGALETVDQLPAVHLGDAPRQVRVHPHEPEKTVSRASPRNAQSVTATTETGVSCSAMTDSAPSSQPGKRRPMVTGARSGARRSSFTMPSARSSTRSGIRPCGRSSVPAGCVSGGARCVRHP